MTFNLGRRAIVAGAVAVLSFGAPVLADGHKVLDSIHFLIPGGAGGGWDGTARGTGEALTNAGLVGSASFENMSGGGGGKAIGYLIENADSNHGTLMVNSTPIVIRSLTGVFPHNPGVTAKDITMNVIGKTGTAGGTGYVIEYCGQAIEDLSMEGRMTVCNMAIEGGARAGLIAPDQKTFDYCYGRPNAPKGSDWDLALSNWKELYTDENAYFDLTITIKGEDIAPSVTWGTSPEDVLPIDAVVPSPEDFKGGKVDAVKRALDYMGLEPGQKLSDVEIDTVFIGSCTNGRIEDLRAAAEVLKGQKIKDGMRAMVVPGSGLVRAQAEEEGLAQIFIDAGFEWRMAGCSMCLAMNPDQLAPEERCAATSNRNFEGRQGRGGRTHLLSPAMAAAAAVTGKLTDIRTFVGVA